MKSYKFTFTQINFKHTLWSTHWNYFLRFTTMLYGSFPAETRLTVYRGAPVMHMAVIHASVTKLEQMPRNCPGFGHSKCIYSLTDSSTYSPTLSLTNSFTHWLTDSFTCSFSDAWTLAHIYTCTGIRTHRRTHSHITHARVRARLKPNLLDWNQNSKLEPEISNWDLSKILMY